MTIDQAIRQLSDQIDLLTKDKDYPLEVALRLGIDALEWIKGARGEGCFRCPPLLEGETDSDERQSL